MKRSARIAIFAIFVSIISASNAFAQFNVNWGKSNDTNNFGYTDLGTYFKNNGYAADQASGENFAKTGYIGFNSGDADPYFWNASQNVALQVVQELAGNKDLTTVGFYTGTGAGKALTEVLGGTENGPKSFSTGSPFGLYINTPKTWLGQHYTQYYTDRAENAHKYDTFNASGGDPQGLIYKLAGNQWLVAWDDQDVTRAKGIDADYSDRDYNDLYLKVTVTPEPVSFFLFLLGAAVLGIAFLRKTRKTVL